MTSSTPPPPPGTTWVGDWDGHFHDRVYGSDPVHLGGVATLLTGVQHRDGSTVSGVAVRVEGTVISGGPGSAVTADLTPEQARRLADALTVLADRAEVVDGIGTPTTRHNRPEDR